MPASRTSSSVSPGAALRRERGLGRRTGRRMKYHPLRELTLTRAREFFREPDAIFWVYVFPILLAVGLGIAFRSKPTESVRVLVEETGPAANGIKIGPTQLVERLRKDPRLQAEAKAPEDAARDLLL